MRHFAEIPLEKYLEIESLTAGQVLNRLVTIDGRSKEEIAAAAELPVQYLFELISGKRRFTTRYSLVLEQVLGIGTKGFFILLQANNDTYEKERKKRILNRPDLSRFRSSTFWDTDMYQLDWEESKRFIINRVFECGTDDEVQSIITFYGKQTVTEILENGKYAWIKQPVLKRIANFL